MIFKAVCDASMKQIRKLVAVSNEKNIYFVCFCPDDEQICHRSIARVDAGSFKYLYTDEFYFSWETVARYIGDNGKYGCLNKDGNLLTEPIFIETAEFEDETARAREETGKVYYINEEVKRITIDYQDGSLTFEMQGLYCRVQEGDGTWGIINREDEKIFSDAEMIEDLQMVTCLGSAIVDGRAVLFELLPFEEDEEIKIIASLILL